MKLAKKALPVAIAAAVSSGFAVQAAASDLAAGAPFNIAAESVNGGNYVVDLDPAVVSLNGNAVGSTITYTPTIDLTEDDEFLVTLGNGTVLLDSPRVFLVADEVTDTVDYNNDGDSSDVVKVAESITALDPVNGVTEFRMRVTNFGGAPANATFIFGDAASETDDTGNPFDTASNLTLRIPQGAAAGSCINIGLEAFTQIGNSLPALDAAAVDLFCLETQFVASWSAGTSTVDVESTPSRTAFVEEGAPGDIETTVNDTDLLRSGGLLTIDNDSNSSIDDFITLVAADVLSVNVTSPDLSAVNTATGANFFELVSATADDANFPFTNDGTDLFGSAIGTDLPAHGSFVTDDVIITVEGGSTVIQERDWTGSTVLTFNDPQYGTSALSSDDSHIWDTNALILQAANVKVNSGGARSQLQCVNLNASDAPYEIVVYTPSGDTVTTDPALTTGTIAGNSLLVQNMDDVITDGSTRRIGMEVILQTAQNSAQCNVLQIRPGVGDETSEDMKRPGTN